jgi:cellulose synthase/poly-beta-1,6-N-acetylglucosamine synthase-like glycosyltransferase
MIINIIAAAIVLLLFYYSYFLLKILSGLKKLIFQSSHENYDLIPEEFISLIIPFRNESENILHSLSSIMNLEYPQEKLEVIFVNDFSDDNSVELLCKAEKPTNIRVLSVPDNYSKFQHKKRAIRFGIENSQGEIIVTTDADCIHSPVWLKTLLSRFDKETGFMSGPVEFTDVPTLFSSMQKLEFSGLVLTGAGLIGIEEPLICNAANIAYRRKAFEMTGGFYYKHSLSSGDDELLMQKIKKETTYKIRFCMNKNAIVKTAPNNNLNQFYNQRKRWASKGLFYSDRLLVLKLILIFFFYLSLPAQVILGIILSPLFYLTLSFSLLIKALLEFLIIKTGSSKLFSSKILRPFIPAEILHIPYILIAGISGVFGNYLWKDRKIKR